jgi:hypothetical protein
MPLIQNQHLRSAFLAALVVIAVPLLLVDYNSKAQATIAWVFAPLVAGMAALAVRAAGNAGVVSIVFWMALAPMAAAGLRVLMDVLRDPTTHNLWPLELFFSGMLGGGAALAGVLLGTLARRLLARSAGPA